MSNFTVTIGQEKLVAAPDTGILTAQSSSANSSTFMGINVPVCIGITALALVSIIAISILFKKSRRTFSNDNHSFKIRSRYKKIIGISVILIVSLSAMAYIAKPIENNQNHALAASNNDSLAIETEDINLEIIRTDKTAYNAVANKITVSTATNNGYTIGVYASGKNIISESNENDSITGLEANSAPTSLSKNTWGLSIVSPKDELSEKWYAVPTSQSDLLTIKSTTQSTPENDTTTVYYGAYVTDELAYGVYTGPTINYIAIANPSDITVNWHDGTTPGTSHSVVLNPTSGDFTYTIQPYCTTVDCLEGTYYPEPTVYNGTVPSSLLNSVLDIYSQLNFSSATSANEHSAIKTWFGTFGYLSNPEGIYYPNPDDPYMEDCSDESSYCYEFDMNHDGIITNLEVAEYTLTIEIPELLAN